MSHYRSTDHHHPLIQALRRDIKALRSSARWRLGHSVISILETILGRRSHHLSIDHMERIVERWERHSSGSESVAPYLDWIAYDWSDLGRSRSINIAILCSHDHPGPHLAGDYYTAMELSEALNALPDTSCTLITSVSQVSDHIDTLVSLLHDEPIEPISPDITCISWIRSHATYWIKRPWFGRFDLHLCSSHKICDFISQMTDRPVYLYPIATNPVRMQSGGDSPLSYDAVFIGSHRPLSPRKLPSYLDELDRSLRIAIYGANWDDVAPKHVDMHGFAAYEEVSEIYAQSHALIDSGHEESLSWHSLNSRVFDGFASGRPVLSDNVEGYKALFGADSLTYTDGDSLSRRLLGVKNGEQHLLGAYADVRSQVLSRHTYVHRATLLQQVIRSHRHQPLVIHLHIATTEALDVHRWGDYHVAVGLMSALTSLGHRSRVVLAEHPIPIETPDVDIHLCGLRAPRSSNGRQQCAWLLSHTNDRIEDMSDMDIIFAASDQVGNQVATRFPDKAACVLPQCSDPSLYSMDGPVDERWRGMIIYVGHHRSVTRRMANYDLVKCGIKVIGKGWHDILPSETIIADELPVDQLATAYRSARAIMVDHHDDMVSMGIYSNKVFDILSAGGYVLSDVPPDKTIQSYRGRYHHYSDEPSLRRLINNLKAAPHSEHDHPYSLHRDTYLHRAMDILDAIIDLD